MLKNKFVIGVIVAAVALVLISTFFNDETSATSPEKLANYSQEIERERKQKDTFFRESDTSPILEKNSFKNLSYFPTNPAYRISAELLPYEGADKQAVVPMTDGSTDTLTKYGYAQFGIGEGVYKLLIYLHDNQLSVLFKDQTAPKETYGGGRYIDVATKDVINDRFTLDFNVAYNPYCAYNPTYACPIPPKENVLPVRIEAGEKNFTEKH